MSRDLHKSMRTIQRHVKELTEKHLIRIKHRSSRGWRLSNLILPGRRIIRIMRYIMKSKPTQPQRKESVILHASCPITLPRTDYKPGSEAARKAFKEMRRILESK